MAEVVIPLQSDNIQTIPGGGVRNLQTLVNIKGVPTQVLQQVITPADDRGEVITDGPTRDLLMDILRELRGIRNLVAVIGNQPQLWDENVNG